MQIVQNLEQFFLIENFMFLEVKEENKDSMILKLLILIKIAG
jgi:hypothetical protein